MTLKKFRDDSDEVIIIIGDLHKEYPMPHGMGHTIWDGYNISNILMMVDNVGSADIDEKLTSMFKKVIEYCKANNYNADWTAYAMNDSYTHLIELYFSNENKVYEYFEVWKTQIPEVLQELGGDDDFFDYTPNFIEMFEQFARIIGKFDEAKELIQQAINESDHDPDLIEEAFGYTKQ